MRIIKFVKNSNFKTDASSPKLKIIGDFVRFY